jgi:hypothetical protein
VNADVDGDGQLVPGNIRPSKALFGVRLHASTVVDGNSRDPGDDSRNVLLLISTSTGARWTDMGQKLGLGAIVVLVGWFVVTAPDPAATTVRHAADSAGHVLHQISVFVRDIWP